jgi:hypothetical protein
MTDCGTTRRSGGAGTVSDSGAVQQIAPERLGRVRHDGVLGEEGEQPGVTDGGLRQDRRDPVQPLELLGPMGGAAGLVRLDPRVLLAHQQGDRLELRAHRGLHGAAPDGRLDLADGAREQGDDVLAVPPASLVARRSTASARLVLASSSHRPLLRTPGRVAVALCPQTLLAVALRMSRGAGSAGCSGTRLGPTDLREIDATGRRWRMVAHTESALTAAVRADFSW